MVYKETLKLPGAVMTCIILYNEHVIEFLKCGMGSLASPQCGVTFNGYTIFPRPKARSSSSTMRFECTYINSGFV